jgi:hypothetical protein
VDERKNLPDHEALNTNPEGIAQARFTEKKLLNPYTTASATAYGNSAYGTARTTTCGGQTFLISKPSTTNTIMCFNGKPDVQGLVYDAQLVCNSLGQKHGVVCVAVAK